MLTYEGMDDLSVIFARELFSTFPMWRRLAKEIKDEKTGAKHVEVDIPQEGTDRQLHVSTENNEITLAFDRWHTHVGTFLGISSEEVVATAILNIQDFVDEETIVTISYQSGAWSGSSLAYVEAPGDLKPNATTHIFSWKRSYDQTIETLSTPMNLSDVLKKIEPPE